MDRTTVNQVTQIGVETTHGTTVAATKILEAIQIEPGIKSTNKSHRSQGRKHTAVVTQGKELVEFKASGEADYAEMVYPFSSALGAATITTPVGGTNSRQWLFAPPLTGNTSVVTYTVEKGDSVRAFKFGYGLFTGVDLKFSRDSVDFSGDGIGQLLSDGITMTPGLSPVGLLPILGDQVNYYVDTTQAGLGGTQFLDCLEAEFSWSGAYGQYWPMVRANPSFTRHTDLAPSANFKMTVQANAAGMAYVSDLRNGDKKYIRVEAIGPVALEATIYPTLTIDMCASVSNVGAFADKDGIYAYEITWEIVEDATWNHACEITLINSLTAL